MRIAVIGGAGFIGSHLVDRLLAEEHEVDVIDDLSTGSLANLADARATGGAPSGGSLKIHHIDAVSSEADSLLGMRRPELVYQLALLPRADRSPRAMGRGFDAALATMEAARRHGVAKVVAAVPASAMHGQPAAAALPVKEGEIVPRGVRGVVARAVIDLMSTYRERDMIEFTALALASVYGPRQPAGGGVVAAFVAAQSLAVPPCFEGDGRQTRDFVYIDDVVDALVRAGERGSGLVINIGTGVQTSVRDLWAEVSSGAGAPPAIVAGRADDLPRFAVSPVRARIHLGWSPWTSLGDGLARTRN
jgi:UDP-glucose 4-epimerase